MEQGLSRYKGGKTKLRGRPKKIRKEIQYEVELSALVDLKEKIHIIDIAVKKTNIDQPLRFMIQQQAENNELADIARDIELLGEADEVRNYIQILQDRYPDQSNKVGKLVAHVFTVLENTLEIFNANNYMVAKKVLEDLAEALKPS